MKIEPRACKNGFQPCYRNTDLLETRIQQMELLIFHRFSTKFLYQML